MIQRLLLVANPKTSEIVEPCVGPLDDPANRRVMTGPLFFPNLLDVAEVSGVLDHLLAGPAAVSFVEAEKGLSGHWAEGLPLVRDTNGRLEQKLEGKMTSAKQPSFGRLLSR